MNHVLEVDGVLSKARVGPMQMMHCIANHTIWLIDPKGLLKSLCI